MVGETPSVIGESIGRGPWGPRTYTNPSTSESALEMAQSACGKWGKWWQGGWEPSKQHCSLSEHSPTYSTTTQRRGLSCPGEYLRFHLLQHIRCTKTKKYGPNERTGQNSRKRTKDKEIDNLWEAELKTLVTRVLTELTDYCRKIEKKMKAIQKWKKGKYTGKQQWREGNWDSNQQFGTDGRNKHPTATEWRNKNSKKWRGWATSGTTLNVPTFES